jgi:hypothetical protein
MKNHHSHGSVEIICYFFDHVKDIIKHSKGKRLENRTDICTDLNLFITEFILDV